MDGILVVCGLCGLRLMARAEFAGRSMCCPKCGAEVPVPEEVPVREVLGGDDERGVAAVRDAPAAARGREPVLKGLNRAQMVVLWVATGVLVLMVLIPPWRMKEVEMDKPFLGYVDDSRRYGSWQTVKEVYGPAGYAPLWAPPRYDNSKRYGCYKMPTGVDLYRLAIQFVGLAVVAGVRMYSLRGRKSGGK